MEFMLLMALATPAKVNCMLMKAECIRKPLSPFTLCPFPFSIFHLTFSTQHPRKAPVQTAAPAPLPSRMFSCRRAFLKSEKFKDCCRDVVRLDSVQISVPRSGQVTPKGNNRHSGNTSAAAT